MARILGEFSVVDVEDAEDVDFLVPSPLSENLAGGFIGSWYELGKFDMLRKKINGSGIVKKFLFSLNDNKFMVNRKTFAIFGIIYF